MDINMSIYVQSCIYEMFLELFVDINGHILCPKKNMSS